jgi:hypothetical protein
VSWVRRYNFRHQASPRASPRESTQRRKVELWARNVRQFCPNADLTCYIQRTFTCRKATTWARWLYFPSEGRRAADFFALKIRWLRTGANPQTWVPKASTLPLDHRSRIKHTYGITTILYPTKSIKTNVIPSNTQFSYNFIPCFQWQM